MAREKLKTNFTSKVEWLRVKDLTVDPSAQRPYNEAYAKKLADNFNPDAIGHPLIAVIRGRGGERYIIADGQHRVGAVRMWAGENEQILCEVVRGENMTIADVAGLYRVRNSYKRNRAIDDFLTGVTHKDKECIAITSILQESGYRVGHASNEREVSAVQALRAIYRMGILPETLDAWLNAWGKTALNGSVLHGVALFIGHYNSRLDARDLHNRLAKIGGGAPGLLGMGRSQKIANSCSIMKGIALAILPIYNSGKSSSRLPDWNAPLDEKAIRRP